MLVLAMAIAAVFVLLSQWQFSSSRDAPPPAPSDTEVVRPLTGVLDPQAALFASVADQLVSFDGEFVAGTQILVGNRLLDDRDGLWVVQAVAVEAPAVEDGTVIPVVLGWTSDADRGADVPEQEGAVTVEGRLLPPEAPLVQPPVDGEASAMSTAELANLWDLPSYAAFVVASDITADGTAVPFTAGLEQVVVGPQPQETAINWLNIFYAIEWVVFAGFAFFLWWRLVADDHRRTLEEEEDAVQDVAEETASEAEREPDTGVDSETGSGTTSARAGIPARASASPSAAENESRAYRD